MVRVWMVAVGLLACNKEPAKPRSGSAAPAVSTVPAQAPMDAGVDAAIALSAEERDALLTDIEHAEWRHDFALALAKVGEGLARAKDDPQLLAAKQRIEAQAPNLVAGHWLKVTMAGAKVAFAIPGGADTDLVQGESSGLLRLACTDGKLSLYLQDRRLSRGFGPMQTHDAQVSADRDRVQTLTIRYDDDKTSLQIPIAKRRPWLARLASARELRVTIQREYSMKTTYRFDVAGADQIAAHVDRDCP